MTGITDQTKQKTDEVPVGGPDSKLIGKLQALVTEAREQKAPIERKWKRWREYYEGKQWQDKPNRPSWRVSNVINVSFANVETALSVVMSMMPKLIANPTNQESVGKAESVTAALHFLWKKLKMRKSVKLALKDSLFYGSGIMKVTWNPSTNYVDEFVYDEEGNVQMDDGKPKKAKQPIGEVSVRRVSPFHLDPDPLCLSLDEAAYTIETKDVDIGYIRKRWPEKARDVTANVIGQPQLDKVWDSSAAVVDTTRDPKYVRGAKGGGVISARSQVKLYEIWVKDIGLLYDDEDNPDWKSLYEKYKNGRVIIMAGDTKLMDIPNPYDDGQLPYIKFDNIERPDMFWGKSEIEPIEPLQKELNRRSSQIMESANLTADPKVLVPRSSGLKEESITTKPGEKIPYMGTAKPEYLIPPALPTYVMQNLDRTMGHVERVSGNYDLLGGARQANISAASAISNLMEQAEKRPRMKMENLNDALREMGELMVSRIRQYYDQRRQIAVSKDDGSGGVVFYEIYNKELGGHYDIEIEVGSNLPTSQTVLFQWAMSLFEIGVLDDKWLLTAIEWPHRDQIIADNEERKAKEQQQQMELAQMGGQSQQGPPGPTAGGPQPPGQFSMRGQQPQGPGGEPPAPPEGTDPEIASLVSQILEAAQQGEGMPLEMQQILGGGR